MFHCDVFCRCKGDFSIVFVYVIPASRHECAGVIWLMRYILRFSGFELVSIPYGGSDMICLLSLVCRCAMSY